MRQSLLLPLLLLACAPEKAPIVDDDPSGLQPLPALASAPTTRERALRPRAERFETNDNPALPENTQGYLDLGLGEVDVVDGEEAVVVTIDDAAAPARGPNVRRLVRFVHLADAQLIDDESPTRAAAVDNKDALKAALRPQDAVSCRLLNAAVRTINGLHNDDALDFVLLGGDNIDNAQHNEARWVMDILNGSDDVHCDSGDDDEIDVDGEDGKDPFASAGLDVPWRWVNGNHDVNVQGNFAASADQQASALGSEAVLGTRVYSQNGGTGSVRTGDIVVPDDERRLLSPQDILTLVGDDGDGHGLKDVAREPGRAFYAFDHGPLTFVVLDTSHARGGSSGVLTRTDFTTFIKPLLDDAQARGQLVVLSSHHAISSLTLDGGTFGAEEADAYSSSAWRDELAGYDNIVFSVVGHSHRNIVRREGAAGASFFEVVTSAVSDWPHQPRVIEIFDDDNGTLRLEATPVDLAVDDDPLAELGRKLGLIDMLSGWNSNDGTGGASDRNVTLIMNKPAP